MTDDVPDRGLERPGFGSRALERRGAERRGLENPLRPGKRVAQAKAKAKAKTKSFAICLAQGDEGTAITAWAGWVHSGEIANAGAIQQGSLEEAFATMIAQLSAGETVNNLWVYGHGDQDGYLHAIPAPGDPEQGFNIPDAQAFVKASTNAAGFHAFCDGNTKVHMYPCNAGIQPDALEAARELFCGGQIGKACGPKHWFHLMIRHVSATNGVKPDAASGCSTLRFATTAASRTALDQELDAFGQLLDADPKCFSTAYAARMKVALEKAVLKAFEDVFVPWFDDLKKAGLVPPKLRKGKAKRPAKIASMWQLLGSPWPTVSVMSSGTSVSINTMLGMPFLSDTLLGWHAMSQMGNWRDAAKSRSHVFPHETAWSTQWASLPAGKLKPC